jgi:NADH-quinone oxidoreductase subunit L
VIWVFALAAAMLTAFYMTRMMVMTFHGTNRTGPEEEKHLHEAPAVMWVPLAVLAMLSVFGGWINVPEAIRTSFLGLGGALPMSEWLHHWLEPVTAQAHEVQLQNLGELSHAAPFGGGEVLWAVFSTAAALVVVLAAFRFVGAQKVVPAAQDTEPTGFAKVLYNKYYVDELYDRIIVQPVVRASKFCWRVIDAGVIDGTVNAVGTGSPRAWAGA